MTARALKRHGSRERGDRSAISFLVSGLWLPGNGSLGCTKLLGNRLFGHSTAVYPPMSKDVLSKKPKEYWDYEKMIVAWTRS